MAKTKDSNHPLRGGKMDKRSDVVYRTRNGKEHSYIQKHNDNPPSAAQKAYRKQFGKITKLVNTIMADPAQVAEWEKRRRAYNSYQVSVASPLRYASTRQFVFASIKEQVICKEAARRRKKPVKLALPKGFKLICKHFSELSTTELYEILKARFAVFYLEQHIYYQDFDDIDYSATHIALVQKGHVIAYVRLFAGDRPGEWMLGRMLTVEQGKGYGKYIIEQAEVEAKRQGAKTLIFHAQTQAAAFYEALGYTTCGSVFMEADIPHVHMKKSMDTVVSAQK